MIQTIQRCASVGIIVAIAAVCLPLAAEGATINMILSDVDVQYNGEASGNTGSIYDTIGQPGGNLNPTEADTVETAVFEVDTTHIGTIVDAPGAAMYGDMRVNGVGGSLPLNTLNTNVGSNGGGFGFDWFTQTGNNLRLGISSLSNVLIANNLFFFSGTATVLSQNLPFGLAFVPNSTVAFSYTSSTAPSLNGTSPTFFAQGSGALTITGELIPEPATISLLGLGLTVLAAGAIRRRSAVR
jgi:hypothetical protein